MARIRSIKPEFWTSEQVVECSTNARLLFVGMWNFCDDSGRHPYSARRLKMCIFPGDDDLTTQHVADLMGELVKARLIVPYVVNGERYFAVSGWSHQKIDRPQPDKYPAPEDGEIESILVDSTNAQRTLDEHSSLIGKDRKGKDRSGEDTPKAPKGANVYSPAFDAFWEAYPRKAGKERAYRAWKKAGKQIKERQAVETNTAIEIMLAAAREFSESPVGRGDYCPHPASWLNGGRYDDDRADWNRVKETNGKATVPEFRFGDDA